MRRATIAVVLALFLGACGVHNQHKGINDARMVVATAAMAVRAADEVSAEYYKTKPADDTDSYCKNKITALVLGQAVDTLRGAAESIRLWEDALVVYLARKDAGENTSFEWADVLNSESMWMTLAADIAGILEYVRRTLTRWLPGKVPDALNYAWKFVSGMAGVDVVDVDFDFDTLQGSVCVEYLPGGE